MKRFCPSFFLICVLSTVLFSCRRYKEMTLAEIEELTREGDAALISKTVTKPWNGEKFKKGKTGGIWYDTILSDPKTFNQLIQVFLVVFKTAGLPSEKMTILSFGRAYLNGCLWLLS